MYNTDVIKLYFFSPYPPDKKFTKVDICTAIILEKRVRVRWCRRTVEGVWRGRQVAAVEVENI